jgi:hypothetical protein
MYFEMIMLLVLPRINISTALEGDEGYHLHLKRRVGSRLKRPE